MVGLARKFKMSGATRDIMDFSLHSRQNYGSIDLYKKGK